MSLSPADSNIGVRISMGTFFLDNDVHQNLSAKGRVKVYKAAIDNLHAPGDPEISEHILRHRNAREILDMLGDHGFRALWLKSPQNSHARTTYKASENMDSRPMSESLHAAHRKQIDTGEWLITGDFEVPLHTLLQPAKHLANAVGEGDLKAIQTILNLNPSPCDIRDDKDSTVLT